MNQYRYPGAVPFETKDKDIFFGRENDTERFISLLNVEKLIVLYAKSGLGKSSLVRAGVIPQLQTMQERYAHAWRVRFTSYEKGKSQTPLQKLQTETEYESELIQGQNERKKLDKPQNFVSKLFDDSSLWLHLKALQAETNNKKGAMVLFFDQFEEFFDYPKEQQDEFKQTLAELLRSTPPDSIVQVIQEQENTLTDEQINFLYKPLEIRIVLLIRSDRMSYLDSMKNYIPFVLSNTYEIKPLNEAQAKEAIEEPADLGSKKEDEIKYKDHFKVHPFHYAPEMLQYLLDFIKDSKNEYEPYLIQLVCARIEKKISEIQGFEANTVIQKDFIDDLKDLIESAYTEAIQTLPEAKRKNAQALIENGLISNGKRKTLDEDDCKNYGLSEKDLENLVNERILRKEENHLQRTTYEVVHDIFIAPIEKLQKAHKAEEELRIAQEKAEKEKVERQKTQKQLQTVRVLLGVAVLFLLVAIGGIYYALQQKEKAESNLFRAAVIAQHTPQKPLFEAGNGNIDYVSNYTTIIVASNTFNYTKVLYKDIDTLSFRGWAINIIPKEVFLCKNLQHLTLWGNQLTTLPIEIGELKNLQNLNLHENQLTTLPAQIGELKNLTSLDLGINQLTSLPPQIGELKNLQNLYLLRNQLTTLPARIGELKNLTSLDLGSNQLTSLPAQIGELKNLTSLNLGSNQLTSLPPQIGELKNLQNLYLLRNQLISLPSQIEGLKNLQSLDLHSNQLTTLPAQVGQLKNLQSLDLHSNQLTTLPAQIRELKNLQSLDLSENLKLDFGDAFQKLRQLKNLQSLDLHSNQLTTLPAQIGELKNLQSLDLNSNQLITLPAQVGELKGLLSLNLEINQLTTLPSEIGELKNLQSLNLSSNQFTTLPVQIEELKNLRSLSLHSNQNLDFIAVSIKLKGLKKLESLDLGFNQLTTLPTQIGELKNLQSLDLYYNQLTTLPTQIGELKNLRYLDLENNPIPKEEQEKIRKLLPNCKIQF
jgi:Leucine-rich repeat (LRR) protein